MGRQYIAWGASKLLHLYLTHTKDERFVYCVDSSSDKPDICALEIHRPARLDQEENPMGVIFAVSSGALRAITEGLPRKGRTYGEDFIYHSGLMWDSFCTLANQSLGLSPSPLAYWYALSARLNSIKPVQTTILGTILSLESRANTADAASRLAKLG